MANNVKLLNRGKRTITGKDYVFKPNDCLAFTVEEGARLKRLYSDELVSIDDVQKQFEDLQVPEPAPAPAPEPAPESAGRKKTAV